MSSSMLPVVEDKLLILVLMARPQDEDRVLGVVDQLEPSEFADERTAAVWYAIAKHQTRDVSTLANLLKGDVVFAEQSFASWVASFAHVDPPPVSRAAEYIADVRSKARTRRVERLAQRLMQDADNPQKCEVHLAEIEHEVVTTDIHQIVDGHHDLMEKRLVDGGTDIITTGFSVLDSKAPLRKGHVAVIAAHTGLGKTTWALNAAEAAAYSGSGVLVVSLEMRRQDLADRLLSMSSHIPLEQIQKWHKYGHNDQLQADVAGAIDKAAELPISVVDAFTTTPAAVLAQCRKQMRKQPFDLLVLDYLQLLEPNKQSGNRAVDVSSCSRAMKTLANELDVAVLLVSQFNRQLQDNEKPLKRYLKESSSIEQDASTIMFLHGRQTDTELELLVDKNRLGEGSFFIRVNFDREHCRFRPATSSHRKLDTNPS